MKYAHYNTQGQILGFYDSHIHNDIPKPNIELTDGDWQDCIDNQGLRVVDINTKAIVEFTPPAPTLDELKAQTKEKVFAFASDTRAKVAGQVDQYKLASWNDKYQRAQGLLAGKASEVDISILQVECEQRGLSETPQQLAATQVAKGQDLAMAVAVIDGMEKAALQAAEAASSEHALEALLEELEAKVKLQSLQAKDSEAKASSSKWWTIFKKAQGA